MSDSFKVNLLASNHENDYFCRFYEYERVLKFENGSKIFLGNKINKICRFCGKDENEASFKNKAHILPEFMNNKWYFSNYECDSCNSHFSLYETSLSSYGGILNTFSKTKGKKGHYKHKGKSGQTTTFIEDEMIKMLIDEPKFNKGKIENPVTIDDNLKTLTFNTDKCSYTPIHVLKAFVKIGICMLKELNLNNYETTIKWLLETADLKQSNSKSLFYVYQKIGPGISKHPWAFLLKKRENFITNPIPTHVLLLSYGLFSFQIFLPGNENDKWIWQGDNVNLPIESHITNITESNEKKAEVAVDKIDFSSTELYKNPKHSFRIGFK